ncbi:AAA family ATPase [Tenacibaculum agarivorans]|uniref:AAA family ATPase n=1 Tax=Tenacibaculum agarivorans TaxID=1908389 RepID=UPI00094BBCEB|nr:AAA family ATPase [Tenacibaculum agarivorans]
MKLSLQNIGILSSADISLDGITVITGENDSGKSTVGKVLYAIVRSFNNLEESFNNSKLQYIGNKFEDLTNLMLRLESSDIDNFKLLAKVFSDSIFSSYKLLRKGNDVDEITNSLNKLKNELSVIKNSSIKNNILSTIDEITENQNIDLDSIKLLNFELSEYFKNEIGNQFTNKFSKNKKASIEFETSIDNVAFKTEENSVSVNKSPQNFPFKDVIFIESPLFLKRKSKEFNFASLRDKNNYLNYKINQKNSSKTIFSDNSKKINLLNTIIKDIISGEFTFNSDDELVFTKNEQNFSLNSVATGLKTFGAIQLLIENGTLNSNTLLIIDEPEVHLHPTWQVKFAEILVRLSKDFAIPIVLTSHSPYFIEAIEAYTIKHEYKEETNFYFAKKDKKGESSTITNINDNLNIALNSISEAYYTLQEIRDELY